MNWLRSVLGGNALPLDPRRAETLDAWLRAKVDFAAAWRPGGRKIVVALLVDTANACLHFGAVAVDAAGIAAGDAFALVVPTGDAAEREESAATPQGGDLAAVDALLAFLEWTGHAPLLAMDAVDCERRFATASDAICGRAIDLPWFDLRSLVAAALPAEAGDIAAQAAKLGIETASDDPLLAAHAGACLLLLAQSKARVKGQQLADLVRRPHGGR